MTGLFDFWYCVIEGVVMELSTIIIIVAVILFVCACVIGFIRWNAMRITRWFNWKKLNINKPMEEYAEILLEEHNLTDVEVKRVGFWASIFVGNTYSTRKKLIRLSWITARRATATNLAITCKLVAYAKLHAEGKKHLHAVEVYRWLSWLPILFLPLLVVGIIIDLIASGGLGMYTLIFGSVGLVFALAIFILACIVAKNERLACTDGQNIILDMGILDEAEEKKMRKLFSAWKKLVVVNVIYNTFQLIFFIFNVLLSVLRIGGKK